MAAALSAIVGMFALHLTLGRSEGHDLDTALPTVSQPPSPKAKGATDSEPGDPDNDKLFWTGLSMKNAAPSVSPRLDRNDMRDDPPIIIDVDVLTVQPGSSSPLLAPDRLIQDPFSEYLALVLEVMPDVLPEHAMELIKKSQFPYKDQVVEEVLQDLLDDPSHPKVKTDFGSVKRPTPTGKNYRTSALVSCPSTDGLPLVPRQVNDHLCHLEPAFCRLSTHPTILHTTRPRFKQRIIRPNSHPARYGNKIRCAAFHDESRQAEDGESHQGEDPHREGKGGERQGF